MKACLDCNELNDLGEDCCTECGSEYFNEDIAQCVECGCWVDEDDMDRNQLCGSQGNDCQSNDEILERVEAPMIESILSLSKEVLR